MSKPGDNIFQFPELSWKLQRKGNQQTWIVEVQEQLIINQTSSCKEQERTNNNNNNNRLLIECMWIWSSEERTGMNWNAAFSPKTSMIMTKKMKSSTQMSLTLKLKHEMTAKRWFHFTNKESTIIYRKEPHLSRKTFKLPPTSLERRPGKSTQKGGHFWLHRWVKGPGTQIP